ncbi:zinc finger protein, partial [Oryctes borbonicus]
LDGQNGIPEGMTVVAALQPQDIQLIQTQHDGDKNGKEVSVTPVALIKSENVKDESAEAAASVTIPYIQTSTAVQEYLQRMQSSTLPLSLHQFLKFNNTDVKREQITEDGVIETVEGQVEAGETELIMNDIVDDMEAGENPDDPEKSKKKKKYKKKPPKPKKPKPGQVHIATALDGTTLFCCPECHMAYPEKELLEQHLIGHKIERRFICDICGAGLKRKEHLERHKLGHNPERPYVCSVCMKGFKRKEHLNLHFVIHSGEKTEICEECGKGFYRKDHLRKHSRSHV